MNQLVLEGTWEEVSERSAELSGRHVLVIALGDTILPAAPLNAQNGSAKKHLYYGMFKGDYDVSEEDFKIAEWRGEKLGL